VPEQPRVSPLLNLYLRMRQALAPFGIEVGPDTLDLWRDQYKHGYGVINAAARGQEQHLADLIVFLQGLLDDMRAERGGDR
jgi:hypothetical protein